jgi:hypothetical protein
VSRTTHFPLIFLLQFIEWISNVIEIGIAILIPIQAVEPVYAIGLLSPPFLVSFVRVPEFPQTLYTALQPLQVIDGESAISNLLQEVVVGLLKTVLQLHNELPQAVDFRNYFL